MESENESQEQICDFDLPMQSLTEVENSSFINSISNHSLKPIQININRIVNETSLENSILQQGSQNSNIFDTSMIRKGKKLPTLQEVQSQTKQSDNFDLTSMTFKFDENLMQSGVQVIESNGESYIHEEYLNMSNTNLPVMKSDKLVTPGHYGDKKKFLRNNSDGQRSSFNMRLAEGISGDASQNQQYVQTLSNKNPGAAGKVQSFGVLGQFNKTRSRNFMLEIPKSKGTSRINSRQSLSISPIFSDVINLMLLSKSIFAFKALIIKDILRTVCGITRNQRKNLLICLGKEIKIKGKLLSIEECQGTSDSGKSKLKLNKKSSPVDLVSIEEKEKDNFEKSGTIKRNKAAGEGFLQTNSSKQSKKTSSKMSHLTTPTKSRKQKKINKPFVVGKASKKSQNSSKKSSKKSRRQMSSNKSSAKKSIKGRFDFTQKGILSQNSNLNDILSTENVCSLNSKINTRDSRESRRNLIDFQASSVKRIMLDSVRFFKINASAQHSDSEMRKVDDLKLVLLNISNEGGGNFGYYQGLGYLVLYYLKLVKDPLNTYQVSMFLIKSYLQQFFDVTKDKSQPLYYTLSELIRVFFPNYAILFPRQQLNNMNLFFESWIGSIFTYYQDEAKCLPFIDQIMDIFIADGWPGFMKVVLAILVNLEPQILKMNENEKMLFFKDFMKESLERLGEIHFLGSKRDIVSGIGPTPKAFNISIDFNHTFDKVDLISPMTQEKNRYFQHQEPVNSNDSRNQNLGRLSSKIRMKRKGKSSFHKMNSIDSSYQVKNLQNQNLNTFLRPLNINSLETISSDPTNRMKSKRFNFKNAVKKFKIVDLQVVHFYISRYYHVHSNFKSEWKDVKKAIKTFKKSQIRK